MVIFPEGGRTHDGKLKPFKKLPFTLAKKANCEIIPLGIKGIYELNNKNSNFIKPVRITMHFGEPISEDQVSQMSMQELSDETRIRILQLLDKD